MKNLFIAFLILFTLSCTNQDIKPLQHNLSRTEILEKGKSARKSTIPLESFERSWKFSAYHDVFGRTFSSSDTPCLSNVVWDLSETFVYGYWARLVYWKVLNFSTNACGHYSSCDMMDTFFITWIINSGYDVEKRYSSSIENNINRVFFREGAVACNQSRYFNATWTIVDDYYLVIYPDDINDGQDIIFTLN